MAKVVRKTSYHYCLSEVNELDNQENLYYGSIVECSCSKLYEKISDQRDGDIWAPFTGVIPEK